MISWLLIQFYQISTYLAFKRTQFSFKLNDWTRKESFCPAPWIHASLDASGGRRLCCMAHFPPDEYRTLEIKDFWNSNYMKDVRKKMMTGSLPDDCINCKVPNKSDSYQKGLRIAFNHHRSSILKTTLENGKANHPLAFLDYRNVKCNFMCKFCGPESSSRWQEQFKKSTAYDDISPGQLHLSTFEMQKNKNLYSLEFQKLAQDNPIEKIYFAGGEPLLADDHLQALEKLIRSKKNHKIHISYNTNLSHSSQLMQTWLEKIACFKKVDIFCSIDGHKEVTEYIRKGINFEKFVKNIELLKQFKKTKKKIFFNLDVTMTSIFLLHIKEFSEFALKLQTPVDAKLMINYEYKALFLRCEFLPQGLRQQLITDWLNYYDQLSSSDQLILSKLKQSLTIAANVAEYPLEIQKKALEQARTHDRLFPEDSKFSAFFEHNKSAHDWLESLEK